MRTWIRGVAILMVGVTMMCCQHTSSKVQLDNVRSASEIVIERTRSYQDAPIPEADVFEALLQATEAEVEEFRLKGEPLWTLHDSFVLSDEDLTDLRLRIALRTTNLLRRVAQNRD